MRARVKVTLNAVPAYVFGMLTDRQWVATEADRAATIINMVRLALDTNDVQAFDAAEKRALDHTDTECEGTISLEKGVYVIRLHNTSVHLLQRACEQIAALLSELASSSPGKQADFSQKIQIVELGKKTPIIEGRVLVTRKERKKYARTHKDMDYRIFWGAGVLAVIFFIVTYPGWLWRSNETDTGLWFFAYVERLSGSLIVTAMLAYAHYRVFLSSLKNHNVQWTIPSAPEQLSVGHRTT